jgi:ubiquinone/menaquinone biosynthesis C-methylase UbiE
MRRYNVTAGIYDMRYAQEQSAKIEAALRTAHINKNSTVLDAGCGTGVLFGHIADKAGMVVGVDFSKSSLLEAKKRALHHENISLVLADVENLPFCCLFEVVFTMTVLQNAPDPQRLLRELRRATADQGISVVSGLKKIFSKQSFLDLLSDVGLKVDVLEDEDNLKCYVAVCSLRHH